MPRQWASSVLKKKRKKEGTRGTGWFENAATQEQKNTVAALLIAFTAAMAPEDVSGHVIRDRFRAIKFKSVVQLCDEFLVVAKGVAAKRFPRRRCFGTSP